MCIVFFVLLHPLVGWLIHSFSRCQCVPSRFVVFFLWSVSRLPHWLDAVNYNQYFCDYEYIICTHNTFIALQFNSSCVFIFFFSCSLQKTKTKIIQLKWIWTFFSLLFRWYTHSSTPSLYVSQFFIRLKFSTLDFRIFSMLFDPYHSEFLSLIHTCSLCVAFLPALCFFSSFTIVRFQCFFFFLYSHLCFMWWWWWWDERATICWHLTAVMCWINASY